MSETGTVEAQLTAAITLPKAFKPNSSQRLCLSKKMHTTHDDHIWPEVNLLITTYIKIKNLKSLCHYESLAHNVRIASVTHEDQY